MRYHEYMRRAVKAAEWGMTRGEGGPFGACIVKGGVVLAAAHNTVLKTNDPTSHAEVNAIRQTSKRLGTFDLSGCDIYSTTEPCPMCFSAIHWAKIRRIYYGTRISDVARRGFNEPCISSRRLKKLGASPVILIPDFLRGECLDLLRRWDAIPSRRTY